VALLRPVKALTELDCEVATLLEAAAGAIATAAAMQDAISTELTGAETVGECEVSSSEESGGRSHILRLQSVRSLTVLIAGVKG
jgi:hypothetical protein